MVIDAHLHLWDKQLGRVGENKVVALKDGKSDFGGEIRQMMPPYMLDGRNTVEMLILWAKILFPPNIYYFLLIFARKAA